MATAFIADAGGAGLASRGYLQGLVSSRCLKTLVFLGELTDTQGYMLCSNLQQCELQHLF